ncbi:MAG TPA: sigma-70 family RNA polymerase sigma factor [Candidatus Limnocylindrales bacterium]|nr:sigma-70 family RNA polymerase sigma factor [Candidatus Limnocylindrales bacterium]
MDQASIIAAVTAGDRDAFGRIVEAESGAVFRTCYRILGRVDEAEDAVQETFVSAFRSLDTFRGEGSLSAWLARIATRLALRRLGQRRLVVSLDPIAHDRPEQGPDPLGAALAAERGERLRAAVAALPDPYREVVALRFFAECSLAEIADATGRPLATVKTHLRRGLLRLRQALGEEAAA